MHKLLLHYTNCCLIQTKAHAGMVDHADEQQQEHHLQTTLDHPPAHQPLRATHQEEEPQIFCQCQVNVAPDSKVHSRHCKDKAQYTAPHAVCILHPVNELELVQAHPPVVECTQACETAISSADIVIRSYCGACVDL